MVALTMVWRPMAAHHGPATGTKHWVPVATIGGSHALGSVAAICGVRSLMFRSVVKPDWWRPTKQQRHQGRERLCTACIARLGFRELRRPATQERR